MSDSIQLANGAPLSSMDTSLFQGFFPAQEAAPPPPFPAGGFRVPLPLVRHNQKEGPKLNLVRQLCADDADDATLYYVTSPPFRAEMVMMAPIVASYRHVAWNDNKKVVDRPGDLSNCEYCLINQNSKEESDRCENRCELVFAVINVGNGRTDPSTWELQGFYHMDVSRSSFDELYTFYYREMLGLANQGIAPFSYIYPLGIKTVVSKYTWNIPRIFRTQDDRTSGYFHREFGKDIPQYRKTPTPPHLIAQITEQLKPGSDVGFAISMFRLPNTEANKAMRDRPVGATAAEVLEAEVVTPATATKPSPKKKKDIGPPNVEISDSAVDDFLGDMT